MNPNATRIVEAIVLDDIQLAVNDAFFSIGV
jgi:hypothetical protein